MVTAPPFLVRLTLAALIVAGAFGIVGRVEAANLVSLFSVSDETSQTRIDHSAWDGLLDRYRRDGPDGVALFAYGTVTAADRAVLDTYISALAATRVTALARPEQLAYWINLYNALTVQVILDNHPVASIRDIKPTLFSFGPWGADVVTVEGQDLSLDDIEHEIMRPVWRDPRIHYVVNCASIGCPDLAADAYTGETVEAQMEAGARAYVNHPRGVRVDGGRVIASSLYDWYAGDFGDLFAHFNRYAEPGLRQQLTGHTRIHDYAYDWALNETP